MISLTWAAAPAPGVGGLDEQAHPPHQHVLDVQRVLVGDRVGDLGAQVRVAVGQRPGQPGVGADQVEHLGRSVPYLPSRCSTSERDTP